MMTLALAWVVTALVFLALDMIWLTQMNGRLYRRFIGGIMAETPHLKPAIAFYLLFVTGVVVFVVAPALAHGDLVHALTHGSLLGLVAYGTYDLTNQATLKAWDFRLTLADMAWGACLTAVSAAAGYAAASSLGG